MRCDRLLRQSEVDENENSVVVAVAVDGLVVLCREGLW